MNTKSMITVLAILLLAPAVSQGQRFVPGKEPPPPEREKREKIEAYQIAYFTSRMNLTPKEAQDFWPVFNAYKQAMEQRIQEGGQRPGEVPDLALMTDQEALTLVDNAIKQVQEMSTLTQQFYTDLKKILPPKKILIFFETERSFKRELLRRLENYRSHGRK